MKLKILVNAMTVAGLLSTSLVATPAMAQSTAKEATTHTKANNDALYGQLPFFDKTDFSNAHKGFIAPLPQDVIKGEKGNIIWNPQQYAFIKEGQKSAGYGKPKPVASGAAD